MAVKIDPNVIDDGPVVVGGVAADLGFTPTYEQCQEVSARLGDRCGFEDDVRAEMEGLGLKPRRAHKKTA